jgi:hypothetical protein
LEPSELSLCADLVGNSADFMKALSVIVAVAALTTASILAAARIGSRSPRGGDRAPSALRVERIAVHITTKPLG